MRDGQSDREVGADVFTRASIAVTTATSFVEERTVVLIIFSTEDTRVTISHSEKDEKYHGSCQMKSLVTSRKIKNI